MSTALSLSRSSRQGCPLSPELFVIWPRQSDRTREIKGVKVDQTIHKINLMADYIILYLTNPFDSLVEFKTVLYICICF